MQVHVSLPLHWLHYTLTQNWFQVSPPWPTSRGTTSRTPRCTGTSSASTPCSNSRSSRTPAPTSAAAPSTVWTWPLRTICPSSWANTRRAARRYSERTRRRKPRQRRRPVEMAAGGVYWDRDSLRGGFVFFFLTEVGIDNMEHWNTWDLWENTSSLWRY